MDYIVSLINNINNSKNLLPTLQIIALFLQKGIIKLSLLFCNLLSLRIIKRKN